MATKTRYRVRNSSYNQALVARSDVTLWFDKDATQSWHWSGAPTRAGNPLVYGDAAIIAEAVRRRR